METTHLGGGKVETRASRQGVPAGARSTRRPTSTSSATSSSRKDPSIARSSARPSSSPTRRRSSRTSATSARRAARDRRRIGVEPGDVMSGRVAGPLRRHPDRQARARARLRAHHPRGPRPPVPREPARRAPVPHGRRRRRQRPARRDARATRTRSTVSTTTAATCTTRSSSTPSTASTSSRPSPRQPAAEAESQGRGRRRAPVRRRADHRQGRSRPARQRLRQDGRERHGRAAEGLDRVERLPGPPDHPTARTPAPTPRRAWSSTRASRSSGT
jgi:hypothetical protein